MFNIVQQYFNKSPNSMMSSTVNYGWIYNLETKKTATMWDIYLLGIAITMGGQFFSWNTGLDEGFWCFLSSTILMGIGYICLTLCLAEMMSALPFTGGLYGFVRVALNPFWGFVVAVCEVLQNIFYISASLFYLGEMIRSATGTTKSVYFMVWIIFFSIIIPIYVCGGKVFVTITNILALYTFLALLLLFILSMVQGQFDGNAEQNDDFEMNQVMERIHLAGWFYIGIEHLPLSGIYCAKPRQDVPRAMVYCILTLFVTAVCIVFASSSNEPGSKALVGELMPFNHVYADRLGMAHHKASWITIIAVFTTAFGFMFALSRQIHAMALSGMIPSLFKERVSFSGAPYIALFISAIGILVVCIPVGYKYHSFQEDIFNWCTISSYFCYVCTFFSFVELRRKYAVVERYFINPFGIPSAFIGFSIFTINFISAVAFQGQHDGIQHRIHPIVGFVIIFIFALIWYCVYAQKYQCFSAEEQKIMFSAYVIKSNMKNKQNVAKKRQANRAARHARTNSTTFFGGAITIMSASTHSYSYNTGSRHSGGNHSASIKSSSDSASSENQVLSGTATAQGVNSTHSNGSVPGSSAKHVPSRSYFLSALFRKNPTAQTSSGMDSESQIDSGNESGYGTNSMAGASVGGISSDDERMRNIVSENSRSHHRKSKSNGPGVSKVIPEDREVEHDHDCESDIVKDRNNGADHGSDAQSRDDQHDGYDQYDPNEKVVVRDSTIEGLRAMQRVFTRMASEGSLKVMRRSSGSAGAFLPSSSSRSNRIVPTTSSISAISSTKATSPKAVVVATSLIEHVDLEHGFLMSNDLAICSVGNSISNIASTGESESHVSSMKSIPIPAIIHSHAMETSRTSSSRSSQRIVSNAIGGELSINSPTNEGSMRTSIRSVGIPPTVELPTPTDNVVAIDESPCGDGGGGGDSPLDCGSQPQPFVPMSRDASPRHQSGDDDYEQHHEVDMRRMADLESVGDFSACYI